MANRKLGWRDSVQEASIDTATAATLEVIAAVSGKTIRVYKIIAFCNAANTLTLKSGSTNLMGVLSLGANTGFVLEDPSDDGQYPFTCASGAAFNLVIGSSQQVSGRVWYTQD